LAGISALEILRCQYLRNLDGVEGCPLPDIVGHDPHVEAVGDRFILADLPQRCPSFPAALMARGKVLGRISCTLTGAFFRSFRPSGA